jgi:Na+-transporting NADH:ubiquinone oxidoreductase subunit F
MNAWMTALLGISVFTAVILGLTLLLLWTRSRLLETEHARIDINGDERYARTVPTGADLLATLNREGIYLPSGCGGFGTCGLCRVRVVSGGGEALAVEKGHLRRRELQEGYRLACQVRVKRDLVLEVPDRVLAVREYRGVVRANRHAAAFIRELVIDCDPESRFEFEAGAYVLVRIPPYRIAFRDFRLAPLFRGEWKRVLERGIHHENTEPFFRAYSLAGDPSENRAIRLNVRIALPPENTDHPPGVASTYLFHLAPGTPVSWVGPYGELCVPPGDRPLCMIGGGAGMAPLRSIVRDQLLVKRTQREICFWYGARSFSERLYHEEMLELAKRHPRFLYTLVLSDPLFGDRWSGPSGPVHETVRKRFLADHPDPDENAYIVCGPPPMVECCREMLLDFGVEESRIGIEAY